MNNKQVLALYDVRGIQDYIFRTPKMRDAIGASHIVEDLFEKALSHALSKKNYKYELKWYGDNGARPFDETSDLDVQVMYIGGGNACVIYRNRDVAVEISRVMSRYTMDQTYSLQLAVAIVDKTDNYSKDYKKLMDEMTKVKDRMGVSKPMDAVPVVKIETKTGLPISASNPREGRESSRESLLKTKAENEVRGRISNDAKLYDNYITEKGESSMLAVVHIDGNNMGARIKSCIENMRSYSEAVTEIRRISYAINTSYKSVLKDMFSEFNGFNEMVFKDKKDDSKKFLILKVIEAGDDITYICNANIALATVEFFLNNISKLSMKQEETDDLKYRFTACAGIAFFNSHFPFHIAYNVAEECCGKAKKRAKECKYMSEGVVGNWMDFQFCRNVHALDLDRIREEEYLTASGENLLRRPYFVPSETLIDNSERFRKMSEEEISYSELLKDHKRYVKNLNNKENVKKRIRNTYPLGEQQMAILKAFLDSRSEKKDGADSEYPKSFYFGDNPKIALLYDALELGDYFNSLEDLRKEAK